MLHKARLKSVLTPERDGAPAHCGHDTDFAIVTDRGLQSLIASRNLAVHKDVHVWPHLAPFCQHAISQTDVTAPKLAKRFADIPGLAVNLDFGLPGGEFGQVT